jgi:DNA-binding NarL/FixJ family response regulator
VQQSRGPWCSCEGEGCSNEGIGEVLNVSVTTVESHGRTNSGIMSLTKLRTTCSSAELLPAEEQQ